MNSLQIIRASFLFLLLSLAFSGHAQTATINAGTTYQTISGWGASTGFNEQNTNMTAAQADCFFSTNNGSCASGNSIGLSWIRIQDNSTANSAPDLPTLLLAQARGACIELGFNNNQLDSSSYSSIAAYDIAKIQYLQSQGLSNICAVSPINEPQNTGTTAAEIDTFVASYLYPQMVSAGLGSIPIVIPESADWFATDYATTCMNDSSCGPHIAAFGGHGYYSGAQAGSITVDGFAQTSGVPNCCVDFAANPPPSSTSAKPLWETEQNGGANGPCSVSLAAFDSSMSDALVWAHNNHDFLTALNGAQWLYWNLNSGYAGCNDGLTDTSFNPAQRFYAIGNWSRFVRPGWVRISATATPQSGVYLTVFMDKSSGAFAIVSVNTNGSSVSQPFSLTGLSTTSVTPWITSSTQNLIPQSNVTVSSNSFTYTLPASSVTTFVGGALNPPTGLSVAIAP
ncbi:MAG: hypothetical protein ACLPND_06235 [Candidatus Korobacteraceae bacterium]